MCGALGQFACLNIEPQIQGVSDKQELSFQFCINHATQAGKALSSDT